MNEEQLREFLKNNLRIEVGSKEWNSGMCHYTTKFSIHLLNNEDDFPREGNEISSSSVWSKE